MKSKGLNPNGDFSSVSKTFRNIWYSIFHMVRWFKILLWCIWTFWKFDLSFRKFFILQTYSFLLKMATALPLSFFYYILVFKKDFQYIKFQFGQVLKNFTTVLVWWKSRVSKPTFNKLLVQIRNYERIDISIYSSSKDSI